MHETSTLLHIAEDMLQIFALSFMAIVYAVKIRWIMKFPAGKERQKGTGPPDTSGPRGARWSLLNIGMPWAMASTRRHPVLYAQFVIFHIAVAISIAMSFLIPYGPHLIAGRGAILALQVIFAAGTLVGLMRLIRRIADPYIRAISSADDYFSLSLLIVWLGFSFLAAPNNRERGEAVLLAYFFLTAFFLIYVPFSKISHYIYYPFARYYLGRTLGHRGVYPMVKSSAVSQS